jgi:hypothetical protein
MATTTQTHLQPTWYGPVRDKYGRTRHSLYAVVRRDGASEASWGCQVVLTLLPKACAPNRYMVTDWMTQAYIGTERNPNHRDEPKRFARRADAKAYAEQLVADRSR